MSASPGLLATGRAQLVRDLRLVWRRRGDAMQPLLFALIVVAMFPLALGSNPVLLGRIAPGVVWVAVLLSGLLTLDSLFRGDLEDGSLEQLLLGNAPLAWLVAIRVAVHWLVTSLPLLVLTPLLAELLQLPRPLLAPLMLSLLVGTPLLSLVGAITAALTVGIRRSGILLAVLALPLFVPVLVFGAGAVVAASQGLPWSGAIYLLAAGLALGLVLVPLAAAAALRIALS
jgi:heme exporter protein B